jgi:NitT/TauT family transport system substrate-binding protein
MPVAAVAKREPLIKTGASARFDATLKDEMNHPEIAKISLKCRSAPESLDRYPAGQQAPRTPMS